MFRRLLRRYLGPHRVLPDTTLGRRLARTGAMLLGVMVAHVAAMMAFEGMAVWPAIWLTLITFSTIGYGDVSASTIAGQASTLVLGVGFGITLLANLAGLVIDYRADRTERQRLGKWRWNMKDHIVILMPGTESPVRYLTRLITELRRWPDLSAVPIQLVTEAFADGLPMDLRELNVRHYAGNPDDASVLDAVAIEDAAYVVILAEDDAAARSDTLTIGLLERLTRRGVRARVAVECVEDANRERFERFMPEATLLRPVRAYPEILARAIVSPGTEAVLEDLFGHAGAHPRRYDTGINGVCWPEVVARCAISGVGTPIAYLNEDDAVVVAPACAEPLRARALYLLVHTDRLPDVAAVRAALETPLAQRALPEPAHG